MAKRTLNRPGWRLEYFLSNYHLWIYDSISDIGNPFGTRSALPFASHDGKRWPALAIYGYLRKRFELRGCSKRFLFARCGSSGRLIRNSHTERRSKPQSAPRSSRGRLDLLADRFEQVFEPLLRAGEPFLCAFQPHYVRRGRFFRVHREHQLREPLRQFLVEVRRGGEDAVAE